MGTCAEPAIFGGYLPTSRSFQTLLQPLPPGAFSNRPSCRCHAPFPSCQRWRLLTVVLVAALILLGSLWELWLAPLRPGGSMLALKVVPLVFVLPALWRGWVRAYQLWTMLILLYLCEGIVRGMSDPGLSSTLGWIETVLAAGSYATLMLYVRSFRAWASAPSGQR